jgi:hypothetical protein
MAEERLDWLHATNKTFGGDDAVQIASTNRWHKSTRWWVLQRKNRKNKKAASLEYIYDRDEDVGRAGNGNITTMIAI